MSQERDHELPLDRAALLALHANGAAPLAAPLLDRRGPPGVESLFPGLALHSDRAAPCHAVIDLGLAARHAGPLLQLAPGLLETPRFRPGLPWLSGTVRAAGPRPGAMALAMTEGANPALQARATSLAADLRRERVGGAAWADAVPERLLTPGLCVVEVGADDAGAQAMLATALARCGAARTLVLLTAPAPMLQAAAARAGCPVIAGPVDPWPLLDAAAELHVAEASSLAILGRLCGVAVHSQAELWLSGNSVTGDFSPDATANFAAAVLLTGTTYLDPYRMAPCTAEHAVDLAAEWRRVCDANRRIAVCVGMQFWKRRRVAQFLHTGARPPAFRRGAGPAIAAARAQGGAIAGWASRMPPTLAAEAAQAGIPVLRVEDGFVRSVGLGSDFNLPCSIVLDGSGLYYDPAQPSDLEHLLARSVFTPALLARARSLVDRLVQAGLTKYNTGAASLPPLPADGRRTILVTGQVADDLSVRLGGAAVSGNLELLRQVRTLNPHAYVIYKSHPDVDAGHRPGVIPDTEALLHADALARGAPMGALIGMVDELHTMTSLAGFEALLRGRRVVVWGRPFYAGWGLTEDQASIPRRTRRLSLEELAAGALLLYPRYLDPVTTLPCPPEVLLDRLADPAVWQPGLLVRARRIQGRLHAALSPLMRAGGHSPAAHPTTQPESV